uniref:Phosphodiesterase n=1 Tax=Rhabditophanes sp. KR3021 TaxID=114890 RepID=A0AC35U6D6_9BILA
MNRRREEWKRFRAFTISNPHQRCQPVPSDFIEKEPKSISATNSQQCSTGGATGRPIQSSSSHLTGSASNMHLIPSSTHARRESFLYKTDPPELLACRPVSRASSVTSSEHPHPAPHGDDLIVTPFAQILASLRNCRSNIIQIANLPQSKTGTDEKYRSIKKSTPLHNIPLPDNVMACGLETMEELDWCLEQLETIQTHRSVSEMASSKFRKMLNKELSHFAESSKSGTQISKFLINTYMDNNEEDSGASQNAEIAKEHAPGEVSVASTSHTSPHLSLFGKAKTAAMSKISGVRKLKSYHSGQVPEYGIECAKEIAVYMQMLNSWGPNIFKIHELSKGHALVTTTYTIIKQRGLIKTFDISSHHLISYLIHLEHHYKENAYHNQIHAADVTQSIHVFLSSPSLKEVFSDIEVLAAIFAAAVHDVDHPGFTNQYLINSNNELAIMYNDESVLEQHHLAVAFKLLQDSNCDFLTCLTKKQRQGFRKTVIDMVLATDMSKHMSLLADLKTMVEAKKVAGTSIVSPEKYNERVILLQSMIHLADLSNPTKPIELYRCWNQRILEEYWRQGDKEKDLGLEVSPMCDRGTVTIEKSQIGFIDYIVHPLFETWAELVQPDAQDILDQLEENRQWYLSRIPPDETEEDNLSDGSLTGRVTSPSSLKVLEEKEEVSTTSNVTGNNDEA